MKLLFDLFPLLLFFAAYKFGDLYLATGVAIAASILQIVWLLVRRKAIEPMHWINLTIIVVFGGATLLLHNELFIKWKPSVLYWLFAVILIGAHLFFNKNLLQSLLGKQLQLPAPIWQRLLWAWSTFFIVVGIANIAVALTLPTETWVTFKVFGIFALLIVFAVAQSLYLGRYLQDSPTAANDERIEP
ncbi:MAG: septation protein A [Pigmentiphaga sp.]